MPLHPFCVVREKHRFGDLAAVWKPSGRCDSLWGPARPKIHNQIFCMASCIRGLRKSIISSRVAAIVPNFRNTRAPSHNPRSASVMSALIWWMRPDGGRDKNPPLAAVSHVTFLLFPKTPGISRLRSTVTSQATSSKLGACQYALSQCHRPLLDWQCRLNPVLLGVASELVHLRAYGPFARAAKPAWCCKKATLSVRVQLHCA